MTRRCLVSAIAVLSTLTSCGPSSGGDDAAGGGGIDAADATGAHVIDDRTSPSSGSGTATSGQDADGRSSAGSSSSTTAPGGDGTAAAPTTFTTTTNTTAKATTAGGGSDDGGDTSSNDGSGDSGGPDDSGAGAADEPAYDPGLKPLVDLARADLAGRLGVGTDRITLVLAELRQWPNSAAGCPKDGLQYQQVPTDGSEIIFTVDTGRYRYVTGGTIYTPMLCE